jgi:hypothetical protein
MAAVQTDQVPLSLYFDVELNGTFTTLEQVLAYLQETMKTYGATLGGGKFTTVDCKWTPHV